MDKEQNKLLPHEWLAAAVVLGFIVSFMLIAFNSGEATSYDSAGVSYQELVTVYIEGAVEHEGSYTVPRGTTVGDLLEKAVLHDDGNISKLDTASRLRNRQRIRVPSTSYVRVVVKGAVENPGNISVPRGTRLCDMHNFVTISPNCVKLTSKRHVKDFETIIFELK